MLSFRQIWQRYFERQADDNNIMLEVNLRLNRVQDFVYMTISIQMKLNSSFLSQPEATGI
jgi:CDP-diacylglycerol pyrophosphatase